MRKFLAFAAAVLLIAPFVFGQAHSDIYGTVVLEDGSAIPGVAVTLTGDKIGTKTTVTSEEGNFRFLRLPPGPYEIKCELQGFQTVIRKGVSTTAGKTSQVQVVMKTTQLEETMTITEQANIIDTRKTQVQATISKEMLQSLPTARNTWTLLNLIPGMMLDRPDVGGAESGQQSSYTAGGTPDGDSGWNLDGADITDNSALGAAPAYFNVNSFEEMQVTLGSNDITQRTSGVQINIVTKRAGNRYSGDFHLYVERDDWEFSPNPPEGFDDTNYTPPGIQRLYQYGVNFGGPLIKDHLWFFGSWGVQDIHKRTEAGEEDATWLVSAYGKLNFQYGNTSGGFRLNLNDKLKWGRLWWGATSQGPGTYWDQYGPTYIWYGNLQQIVGNLMLNAKVAFTDGGFALDPRGADVDSKGVNAGLDWWTWYYPITYRPGSVYEYGTDRNQWDLSLDGNYFLEGALGADHEIRFGVGYLTADTTSRTLYPNQRMLYRYADLHLRYGYDADLCYVDGDPSNNRPNNQINVFESNTNGAFDVNLSRLSFYVSDTATFGKLTATLGIRYDREVGQTNAATAMGYYMQETGATIPEWEPWLSPISVPAADGGTWEVISPRLSLTYDITGDGKNVVKMSAARYGSAAGNGLSGPIWAAGVRGIGVPWIDKNENEIPEIGEFTAYTPQEINAIVDSNPDLGTWHWYFGFDYTKPGSVTSSNQFASDYGSPLTDELTLSFEKALGPNFAVNIAGFYKKTHNLTRTLAIYSDGTMESKSDWEIYDTAPVTGQDLYRRTRRDAVGSYYTNYEDRNQTYLALQGILSKKLSDGWMAEASFTLMDWINNMYENETFSLTNFSYNNGGVVAPASGGSGLSGVYVNSNWMFKLNGLIQLPLGFNLTGTFEARAGYIIYQHDEVYRGYNLYKKDKTAGDDRLPTYWMANLGLEKTFKVSETATATLFVDAYNVFNHQATLKVNTVLGPENGRIMAIVPPGILQFGFRLNF